MSAFAFQGTCYASPGEALEAFNASFPVVTGSYIIYMANSTVDAVGNVNYVTNVRNVTNQGGVMNSATLMLSPCSEPSPKFKPEVAAGIWFGFFSTIITLYLLSKNIGVLLSLIRRS